MKNKETYVDSFISIEKNCAIIVSYFPDENLLSLVRNLVDQDCDTLVVDNGSSGTSLDVLSQCMDIGAEILKFDENHGIGYALNCGCRFWEGKGRSWIFTFDQDSKIESQFVYQMTQSARLEDRCLGVAIYAPVIEDEGTRKLMQSGGNVAFTITSGNLIDIYALKSIGYFNEALFIDYVDFDLCIRLRKAGYRIRVCKEAQMIHSIGEMKRFKSGFLGFEFDTTNHASIRRYYKHRNYTYMFKSYIFLEPLWMIKQGISLFLEPIKIILAEEKRSDKLTMIARGWIDGIMGKYGRYNAKD
jgi:rhamnosyltransferase